MEQKALVYILLYFLFPLWILVGVADWFCHRRTHIEENSGFKESLMHSLMFLEIGLPLLLGLILEINSALILFMIVMFFLHELTSLWDVSYACKHRHVSPVEQHIHSFLEILPLTAILIVIALHWDSFVGLFSATEGKRSFTLSFKSQPLPLSYLIPLFLGVGFLVVLPYAEELYRTLQSRIKRAKEIPTPHN